MIFRQNSNEFVQMSDASPSEEVHQFAVAVALLYQADDMLSLRPRDTSNCTELVDKLIVRVNVIC